MCPILWPLPGEYSHEWSMFQANRTARDSRDLIHWSPWQHHHYMITPLHKCKHCLSYLRAFLIANCSCTSCSFHLSQTSSCSEFEKSAFNRRHMLPKNTWSTLWVCRHLHLMKATSVAVRRGYAFSPILCCEGNIRGCGCEFTHTFMKAIVYSLPCAVRPGTMSVCNSVCVCDVCLHIFM